MTALWTTMGAALLALLFARAAWHKLADRARWLAALEAYHLLPMAMRPMVGWVLPRLEAAVALALLLPPVRREAAGAAALLLLLFAGAAATHLLRGRGGFDCGCGFDRGAARVSWPLVARQAAWLGMAAALALATPPEHVPAQVSEHGPAQAIGLLAALALAVLWTGARALATVGKEEIT